MEDVPESARILAEIMQSWHMQYTVAESSQSAVDAMDETIKQGTGFDFILVDAQIAGEDGSRVAEHILKRSELPSP